MQAAIPRKFLEQILLQLKANGLVESRRGRGGGYLLVAEPADDHRQPGAPDRRRPDRAARLHFPHRLRPLQGLHGRDALRRAAAFRRDLCGDACKSWRRRRLPIALADERRPGGGPRRSAGRPPELGRNRRAIGSALSEKRFYNSAFPTEGFAAFKAYELGRHYPSSNSGEIPT